MEKKKTIYQFKKDVASKISWNAMVGFWYGFIYMKYKEDILSYEQAIDALVDIRQYTGT